jgi:hypothetical protein
MRVFLEIEAGKYKLRVSPYAAQAPTAMHERGKPFPPTVTDEYTNVDEAILGLQHLSDYFRCYEEKQDSKPRRGSKKGAAS